MRCVFTGLLSLVFMATMFLITGVPTVHALVEEDWPHSTPNTCRYSNDFFLDFESGIDEIEIESTIPSLKFTTTGELNWKYGDIRTEKYNVYPYGGAWYETNGNFFAWLGTLGDQGRIDFLGGGASYCSVLVSTGSGLTLDAYDSDDTLIATSGWADPNTGTRTFTRLTVEAPAGQTIAYVMIHDTGNFWLIDDLCTDANKAVIPVTGRGIGSHSDKFDIVFVPDNDYGAAADVDTWLPAFFDHIDDQLDLRLDGAAPVTGNLCKFNFYYTKMQGVASSKTLPADLTRVAPFADSFVIFHTAVFGDSASMSSPSIYGAEGEISAATQNGRSFIHESGHGIFGLADEYDGCGTFYFQPDPMPNIWATEDLCRADATSEGWNPDDCWKFTDCQDDWWKLGTIEYIMFDGTRFSNGWGVPGERRIQWFLDQFPACAAAEAFFAGAPLAEKSIWLNIQVSEGVFTLIDKSFVVDSPPNYFPGAHDFMLKVFSNGGALLGEYGINDPRRIIAESGYMGPTWIDNMNFQLVLPYFDSCGIIDLTESATGTVKLSVDISQYATAMAPVAVCQNIVVDLDENGEATISAGDVDGGSYDPEGGAIELSIDKSDFSCADLGDNSVTLTVTDEEGAPAACTAIVTVEDTMPPEIQCNAPAAITPPDAPISFTATGTDNCSVSSVEIIEYDCFFINKQGKKIDKKDSCGVEFSGDTITIQDSGGVGDHITWTILATDNSGNQTEKECYVDVVNPGN